MKLSEIYRFRVALIWILLIILFCLGLGLLGVDAGIWSPLVVYSMVAILGVWFVSFLLHKKDNGS
jgi:hypothetical protein